MKSPAKTFNIIANCGDTDSFMLLRGDSKQRVGWTCQSDSTFCQITLALLYCLPLICISINLRDTFVFPLFYLIARLRTPKLITAAAADAAVAAVSYQHLRSTCTKEACFDIIYRARTTMRLWDDLCTGEDRTANATGGTVLLFYFRR